MSGRRTFARDYVEGEPSFSLPSWLQAPAQCRVCWLLKLLLRERVFRRSRFSWFQATLKTHRTMYFYDPDAIAIDATRGDAVEPA